MASFATGIPEPPLPTGLPEPPVPSNHQLNWIERLNRLALPGIVCKSNTLDLETVFSDWLDITWKTHRSRSTKTLIKSPRWILHPAYNCYCFERATCLGTVNYVSRLIQARKKPLRKLLMETDVSSWYTFGSRLDSRGTHGREPLYL